MWLYLKTSTVHGFGYTLKVGVENKGRIITKPSYFISKWLMIGHWNMI